MLFEERCRGSIMSHIGGGLEEQLRYAVELKLQSRKLRTCCAPMLTLVRRATCSAEDGEHSQFLKRLGLVPMQLRWRACLLRAPNTRLSCYKGALTPSKRAARCPASERCGRCLLGL